MKRVPDRRPPSRQAQRATVAIVLVALFAVLALLGVGEVLSQPTHRKVGLPPQDLHAEQVRMPLSSTEFVSGWFVPGTPLRGAVLLLHGVRSDRLQMVERARLLHGAGYSVLLIDLPGHGESSGERITFGVREADGVAAALAYLRHRAPRDRIGVIGVSLGAAALVLSHPTPPPDAVVLESMYPTIREAVKDRLAIRLGPFGSMLTPLLLWQLPVRLGINERQLRPIDAVPALGAPVLIASGRNDLHTTWGETERIFAAAAQPKDLWRVDGAAHVDLHSYAPAEYEHHVLGFLAKYLPR
jgi:fermentation-respiration switch protein FrsA (DUF1100 family)